MIAGQILVTGATGFLGRVLCDTLSKQNLHLVCISRFHSNSRTLAIGEFDNRTNWRNILQSCEVVVHLAARAHVLHETSNDPLAAFRAVNVEGTLNLARQAAAVGVKRFVFISSIGVNGAKSIIGSPFTENDLPQPYSPYALSKWEAEQGLREISATTGLEVVIIRPPLVYGPNSKGNFASMLRWLRRGVPLPFGSIYNRRSLVGLDNLCDLIVRCIDHPSAAGQTFMVSDDEDLSTTELLKRTAAAMGIKPRLINIPQYFLEFSAHVFSQDELAQRLFGSLQVDISKTKDLLNWKPLLTVDEGLRRAVS